MYCISNVYVMLYFSVCFFFIYYSYTIYFDTFFVQFQLEALRKEVEIRMKASVNKGQTVSGDVS